MKRLLLLMTLFPLLAAGCGEDKTADPAPEPPAAELPAGTREDPFGVDDIAGISSRTAVWIKGYVAGAEADAKAAAFSVGSDTPSRSNILLAAKANEYRPDKCIRVELAGNSDIQARLNIVDHPDLVGRKVMLRGDIVSQNGTCRISNITEQEGGGEPVENPDPEPGPDDPTPPVTGNVEVDKLYGYAEGTTGGAAAAEANIHHFDDGNKFREWLYLREKSKSTVPAIVWLSGKFTKENGREGEASPWFDIKRTQNISIYGTDGFVMENVGFFLNEAENIVIRNIYIKMPKAENGADGISMQESRNVWVDHCTFESINQTKDYEDGSCDVTHQTCNVTVSWCHFIKTQKSCLVGHSNSQTADTKITATFHHNYFDRSNSRHPRVRFGRAHVYNNYFNRVSTYGVGSAYGAMVLVEDNCFEAVKLPTDICTFPAKPSGNNWVSNLQGSEAGYLYERGNLFNDKPADAPSPYPFTNVEYKAYNGEKLLAPLTYDDFKPAYHYITDPADRIAEIVPSAAGAGKLTGYASAPREVDNGGITGGGTDPGTDPDPVQPGGSDLGNGWTLLSNGTTAATAVCDGGKLALTACGKFESGVQTFAFVYREITGDFTATAQVDSYAAQKETNQALAGLMVTPDVTTAAGGDFIHVMAARSLSKYYYSNRTEAAAKAGKGELGAPQTVIEGANPIVRIERSGDRFTASYSLDGGATFGAEKSVTVAGLPGKLLIGLAANSGDGKKTSEAVFSSVKINGQPVAFE